MYSDLFAWIKLLESWILNPVGQLLRIVLHHHICSCVEDFVSLVTDVGDQPVTKQLKTEEDADKLTPTERYNSTIGQKLQN